jgi:hypothetical protein
MPQVLDELCEILVGQDREARNEDLTAQLHARLKGLS